MYSWLDSTVHVTYIIDVVKKKKITRELVDRVINIRNKDQGRWAAEWKMAAHGLHANCQAAEWAIIFSFAALLNSYPSHFLYFMLESNGYNTIIQYKKSRTAIGLYAQSVLILSNSITSDQIVFIIIWSVISDYLDHSNSFYISKSTTIYYFQLAIEVLQP